MKLTSQESAQAIQRVRVGLTGLATVVVLIGVASVIFSSVNRDRAVSAAGAANAEVVANLSDAGNNSSGGRLNEPLAEIGVAPSTIAPATNSAAPAPDRP